MIPIIIIMNIIKKIFIEFDLFSALPTLRARGETDIMSIFGGILSFLLIGTFTFVFVQRTVNVLEYRAIEVTERQQTIGSGEGKISGFNFAVGISQYSYSQMRPYARITMYKIFQTILQTGEIQIIPQLLQLQQCRIDHFQELGSDGQQVYNRFFLKNFLCPKNYSQLEVQNHYTSNRSTFIYLSFDRCTWQEGCAENAQQHLKIVEAIDNSRFPYIQIALYFVDNFINPSKQIPVSKTMKFYKATLSLRRGNQVYIPLNKYKISTDVNLWPFSTIVQEEGYIAGEAINFNYEAYPPHPYMSFILAFQTNAKVVERTIGKIQQILSYVGGLFSIIISFLGFFMLSYNEYRYEIIVAEGAFNFNQDGRKLKEEEFNFMKYIKYSVYDWIQTLGCCQLDWEDCKEIEGTREEAIYHMDVSLLFKKLQHHERSIEYLISKNEEICLYLTEPPSLDETTRKRRLTHYYDKIIKGQPAMTIEDVQLRNNIQNILSLSLNRVQRSSGFSEVIDTSRQNIINYAFQHHPDEMCKKDEQFEFEDEDLEIEKQFAEAFYQMKFQHRLRIQQKIPIKILHRLLERYKQISTMKNFQIKIE